MASAPPLTCAEIAEHSEPIMCAVTGTAVPGANGLLRAPFSGDPCVWHRIQVAVHYLEEEVQAVNDSEGVAVMQTQMVERASVVHDEVSAEPFSVEDHTGRILIGADRDVDSPIRSHMESVPGLDDLDRFGLTLQISRTDIRRRTYTEWILTEGTPMYVRGAAHNTGDRLELTRPYAVSTKSRDELLREARSLSVGCTVLGGLLIAISLAGVLSVALNG